MGVRGLTTFFNQNSDFFKPYKLHDSLVIVDGDNLIHALYFDSRINLTYGGDYKKYADFVRRYLVAYLECNIIPIVIFDGGYDKSGRKMKTISDRAKQRLQQVKKYVANGGGYENILPILARSVFMSVLSELDIIFATCDYEADDQITALANYFKCPVISSDSDFYIYDLDEGFVRLDTIDTTIVGDIDSDGNQYSYLRCNIYHIDRFASYFPGIDKNVLPLFGALMGNDYVEAKEFDNFFSNIQLPKYKGRKLILNMKQRKMIGLLCWLKNYTLSEAIDKVIEHLKKEKRVYIKSVIENAVSGYQLKTSNLSRIINKKLSNEDLEICPGSLSRIIDKKSSNEDLEICPGSLSRIIDKKSSNEDLEIGPANQLTFPCGACLPSDFVLKCHVGFYASFFINVIVSRKVFLNAQIEDIAFASSYACSRYIRQIMYGILIGHDDCCQNATSCLAFVEENDRKGTNFCKKLVEPLYTLDGFGRLPKIDELNELKKEQSLLILTKTLGIDSDFFSNVPEEWQLYMGCCNYWLRSNSHPYCTESFLYALILNLIYYGVIHNMTKNMKYVCPNGDPCTCSTIQCILSKINKTELENAKLKFKKYRQTPVVNRGNPLLIHIIHNYSQLQSCVLCASLLNHLLGNYLPDVTPQLYFSGTMLYNFTKDISNRTHPTLFVAEILGRDSNLYALFSSLDLKMRRDVVHCILRDESLKMTKRKKASMKGE